MNISRHTATGTMTSPAVQSYRSKFARLPTVEERLANRKEKVALRRQQKREQRKRKGSLLERIIAARVLLKKTNPRKYSEFRESFVLSPGIVEEDMTEVASVELVDETVDRPRSQASSRSRTSSQSSSKGGKSSPTSGPSAEGGKPRAPQPSSPVITPSTSMKSRTTSTSSTSSVTSSSSSGKKKVIKVAEAQDSDTLSYSSDSSVSSRGMPADEFNRIQSSKRSTIVRSMLKNTMKLQEEEYQKSVEVRAEEEVKRSEREKKNEERLRTQAIRGQVADEFTRIKYSLPYFAQQSAETDNQIVKAILRLALRKPQARFKLGQLIMHLRKMKSDPVRPSTASTDASEPDNQFMEDFEKLIKDVTREPKKRKESCHSGKFPVPDVYSVKPLPEDLTGSVDSASLDRRNSQQYVRALEQMVDSDLAKVIADSSGDTNVKKNKSGHKNSDFDTKRNSIATASDSAVSSIPEESQAC